MVKAFYMEPDPQQPELGPVCGRAGARRLWRDHRRLARTASDELLIKRIHEHGLPEEAFKWYLDLRKYGGVPHSGFGMGIERTVAWICGLEHVRETIPFARTLHRLVSVRAPVPLCGITMCDIRTSGFLWQPLHHQTSRDIETNHIRIIGVPLDLGQSRRGVTWVPRLCASPDLKPSSRPWATT